MFQGVREAKDAVMEEEVGERFENVTQEHTLGAHHCDCNLARVISSTSHILQVSYMSES
jgi:hypothetical protein